MENITCEINGVKYVIFEYPVSSIDGYEKMTAKCLRHNAILKGVKCSLTRSVVYNILVPEISVDAFNKENMQRDESELERLRRLLVFWS